MRHLFTRRWALFLVAIGVLAYGCLLLGEWQFSRLHDREERNEIAARNLDADPVALSSILSTTDEVRKDQEWEHVAVTGEYVAADTLIVRYQTRDGRGGVDVVTPLLQPDGTAVLVNRGWMAAENVAEARAQAPAPPTGQVDVLGWVRADGTGSSTKPNDGSVRSISSRAIGETLDYPLVHGFLELDSEDPQATEELLPVQLPDFGEGPHFFYGLQWWFFGCLAVGGFIYLAYDEVRKSRRAATTGASPEPEVEPGDQSERVAPPSTQSATPVRYEAAGESTNAATRPNSSGTP